MESLVIGRVIFQAKFLSLNCVPGRQYVDALGDAGQGGRSEGVARHVRPGVVVVDAVLAVAHVLTDVGDLGADSIGLEINNLFEKLPKSLNEKER